MSQERPTMLHASILVDPVPFWANRPALLQPHGKVGYTLKPVNRMVDCIHQQSILCLAVGGGLVACAN